MNPSQLSLPLRTFKFLKAILIGELIYAIFTVVISLLLTYFAFTEGQNPDSSFPSFAGLLFFILPQLFYFLVSTHIKLIGKNWNVIKSQLRQYILFPHLAIFGICFIFHSLASVQYPLYLSSYLRNLTQEFLSIFILAFFLTFIISSFYIGGLSIYNNLKKKASIPWWNFAHVVSMAIFIVHMFFFSRYELGYQISAIYPIIFTGLIALELKNINKSVKKF